MSGRELDPDGTNSYHPHHPWEQAGHALYIDPSLRTTGNWPPTPASPVGPAEAAAWKALPSASISTLTQEAHHWFAEQVQDVPTVEVKRVSEFMAHNHGIDPSCRERVVGECMPSGRRAAGFHEGVAEGLRQARAAVAGVPEADDLDSYRKPEVIWTMDALSAIDALAADLSTPGKESN